MRFFAPAILFVCTSVISISPAHARSSDRVSKQVSSISQNEKLLMDRAEGRSEARIASSKTDLNQRKKTSWKERRVKKNNQTTASQSSPKKAMRVNHKASSTAARATGLKAKVQYHAAKHGVPADLAHGVVMVESRYNARATGPGGYIGLMQLSYRTAKGMGYQGSRAALYDPDTNLHFGMKYLAGAYQKSGGSMCGAVSKYQGGHGVKGITRSGAVYCSKVRKHIADLNRGKDIKLALN